LLEALLELGAGVGDVLEELDGSGELNDEGFVRRASGSGRGEHVFEELGAGGALGVEDGGLAAAGVDEETNGKGDVSVVVEVAEGLGLGIDFEIEVGLGEVVEDRSLFIADYGGDDDELGVDGDGVAGVGAGGGRSLRGEGGGQRESERKGLQVSHVGLDGGERTELHGVGGRSVAWESRLASKK